VQYSAICYPETVSEVCGWHSEAGATDSRTELRRRQGGGRPRRNSAGRASGFVFRLSGQMSRVKTEHSQRDFLTLKPRFDTPGPDGPSASKSSHLPGF
jgi:hypothetical protein